MAAEKRKRDQVVVYLEPGDRALLERLCARTGLSKTEVFRRGLRRLEEDERERGEPGSSLSYLVHTAKDDGFPADVAERHDDYLYGGGYEEVSSRRGRRGRAGSG